MHDDRLRVPCVQGAVAAEVASFKLGKLFTAVASERRDRMAAEQATSMSSGAHAQLHTVRLQVPAPVRSMQHTAWPFAVLIAATVRAFV